MKIARAAGALILAAAAMLGAATTEASATTSGGKVVWGVQAGPNVAQVTSQMNAKPGIISADLDGKSQAYILQWLRNVRALGSVPMVQWEPTGTFYDVYRGRDDAQLKAFQATLKAFGHPVLWRLWPEFNGSFERWYVHGSGPYAWYYMKAAWRRAHWYVPSGRLIWNPIRGNENISSGWYPGASYVAYVGVDIYDWSSTTGPVAQWSQRLTQMAAFDGHKQVIVAEAGRGSNYPGAKYWLYNALKYAPSWNIEAFVYFDQNQFSTNIMLGSPPAVQTWDYKAVHEGQVVTGSNTPLSHLDSFLYWARW